MKKSQTKIYTSIAISSVIAISVSLALFGDIKTGECQIGDECFVEGIEKISNEIETIETNINELEFDENN